MLNKYLWNEEMKRIPKLLQTISMELDDPSLSSSKYPQPEVHKNKTNINSWWWLIVSSSKFQDHRRSKLERQLSSFLTTIFSPILGRNGVGTFEADRELWVCDRAQTTWCQDAVEELTRHGVGLVSKNGAEDLSLLPNGCILSLLSHWGNSLTFFLQSSNSQRSEVTKKFNV